MESQRAEFFYDLRPVEVSQFHRKVLAQKLNIQNLMVYPCGPKAVLELGRDGDSAITPEGVGRLYRSPQVSSSSSHTDDVILGSLNTSGFSESSDQELLGNLRDGRKYADYLEGRGSLRRRSLDTTDVGHNRGPVQIERSQ